MERKAIPFVGDERYQIDRAGQIYSERAASRPGRPPRTVPVKSMTRQAAEDASRHILGGRSGHGRHFSLVAPPWFPPAAETPMVMCVIHRAQPEQMRGGPFIEARGDTESGWYHLDLGPGTAIVHGPSVAAIAFKIVTDRD